MSCKIVSSLSKLMIANFIIAVICISAVTCNAEDEYSVQRLINLLDSGNASIRLDAATRLGELGPEAKDAVSALRHRINDKKHAVAVKAVWALGEIGPDAHPAVSYMIPALAWRDPVGSDTIVEALVKIGSPANKHLIAALDSPDWVLQFSSLMTLNMIDGAIDEAFAKVIKLLKSPRPEIKKLAVSIISDHENIDLKYAEPLFDAACYLQASKNPDDSVLSEMILDSLIRFSDQIVPLLIDELEGEDTDRRIGACMVLGEIGRPAKDSVEALKVAMGKSFGGERLIYARCISYVDPQCEAGVQICIDVLNSTLSNENQRRFAISALARYAAYFGNAGSAILEASRDADYLIRATVIASVHAAGLNDWRAKEIIQRGLEDDIVGVVFDAIVAAADMGGKLYLDAVEEAKSIMEHPDEKIRAAMLQRCVYLSDKKEFEHIVIKALEDNSQLIRSISADYFVGKYCFESDLRSVLLGDSPEGKIEVLEICAINGINDLDTVAAIIRLIKYGSPPIRAAACRSLQIVDSEYTKVVIGALILALDDPEPIVKLDAIKTLAALAPESANSIGRLMVVLKSTREDKFVREACAEAIGEFGLEAAFAIPTLRKYMRSDPNVEVRQACYRAITKIESESSLMRPGIR